MAYITPNSTIWILKNIDIDEEYNHTLFSQNLTEQHNKFFAVENNTYKYMSMEVPKKD